MGSWLERGRKASVLKTASPPATSCKSSPPPSPTSPRYKTPPQPLCPRTNNAPSPPPFDPFSQGYFTISNLFPIGIVQAWTYPGEMEEFQEADVLWPEEGMQRRLASGALPRGHCSSSLDGASGNAKETAPMAIPSPASRASQHHRSWKLEYFAHRDGDDGNGGGDDDDDDKEMVPPHVLVARRISGKMAFSVCTGQGRTLKGRDLSQVRNSILRLTGFLEG